jgi:hypothetical protein
MQSAFFGLFLLGALYAIWRRGVLGTAPSPAEIVLYAAAVLSVVVTFFRAMDELTTYSVVFLTALILISIMSRAISLEELLDIAALASLLAVFTSLLLDRHDLVKALSISMGREGLFRFHPLNTHPDLAGLIFGSCSILMARRALIARRRIERALMIAGVVLGSTFVLAASARASVVAMVVAVVSAVVLEIRPARATYFKMAGFGAAAIGVISLVSAGRILGYLQGILEFNSKYRGVTSGGSGRTELWVRGISRIFSDPIRLIFGGGLRSSEYSYIGFFTEDSYISILLDSGLFVGTAVIGIYLYTALKALRLSRSESSGSNSFTFLFAYFVFLLTESCFNRYLLAMGNAGSLLALMILISISLRQAPKRELTTVFEYPGASEPHHTHLERP